MKSCTWKEDDDGIYETECGGAFFFDTGNVEENRFKFCPYCGDLIAAHPPEAEGEKMPADWCEECKMPYSKCGCDIY